jgi:hypothetical protein
MVGAMVGMATTVGIPVGVAVGTTDTGTDTTTDTTTDTGMDTDMVSMMVSGTHPYTTTNIDLDTARVVVKDMLVVVKSLTTQLWVVAKVSTQKPQTKTLTLPWTIRETQWVKAL